jgi:hypothetical protein
MVREMTLGEIKEFAATIQGFDDIKREAVHYLSLGSDCFTVSAGPWTLTYDCKLKFGQHYEEVRYDKNH